jgi:Uncharacterized protein conserved in bacteria (DUF2090)
MSIGYDKPLYVLPFDHRASFSKELFGLHGTLSQEQIAEIAAVKRIIFDAANAAEAAGVPKQRSGILVDEQFGAAILHDARDEGLITACPAEKSGQQEFDFESRTTRRRGRARRLESRRTRPQGALPEDRCGGAARGARQGRLHRTRPPRSRRKSAALARDCRISSWIHRIRGWPDLLLGPAC